MVGAIRYRAGINAVDGQPLIGVPHLVQSLGKIWTTRLDSLPMLLDFGNDLRGLLSEDIEPALSLAIYNELVVSAARWEPEYELTELQLVVLKETGALGLRHGGIYYPEGRLGNYDQAVSLSIPAGALVGGAAR